MQTLISKTLEARLNKAAELTGRTPQAIISAAIGQYIEQEKWLSNEIKKGIDSAKKHQTVRDNVVWEEFEAFRKQSLEKNRKAA